MKRVALDLDLTDNWRAASYFRASDSAIVLVELDGPKGSSRARFDLDKRRFIDRAPQLNQRERERLVEHIEAGKKVA